VAILEQEQVVEFVNIVTLMIAGFVVAPIWNSNLSHSFIIFPFFTSNFSSIYTKVG
jgi:hypothetical protein